LPEGGTEKEFQEWHSRWMARSPDRPLMLKSNPAVIPRNHRVEEALAAATVKEDFSLMEKLLEALKRPYEELPGNEGYRGPPAGGSEGYRTFCGT